MQRRRGGGGEKKGETIRSRAMREGLERLGGASPQTNGSVYAKWPEHTPTRGKGTSVRFSENRARAPQAPPARISFLGGLLMVRRGEKYFIRKSSVQP